MKKLYAFSIALTLLTVPTSFASNPSSNFAQKPGAPNKILPMPNPEVEDEADIYNKTILIAEDFSKFTAGSLDSPDKTYLDGFIDESLTAESGWSAQFVSQAGGCALIDRKANVNANLSTPVLEIPANGKPVVVTFKARLADPSFNFDYAEVYMVDTSSSFRPITFTNDYAYLYSEWRDYKFVLDKKRTATSYFFMFNGYDAPMYIDDIEIKFLDPKVEAPVATEFDNFTSKGFTAHWQPVEGADSYLINLFTITYDREKTRTYLVRDLKVNGTSHTFSDIDTSVSTFYYTVRAVNGSQNSPESNPVKVNGLEIPGEITFTPTENGTIKLSWDAIPGTQYYEVIAERSYEATSDMTYTIAEENFDQLVSYGTYTKPEELMSIYEELDDIVNQPGWIAQNPVHINGAYGLVGYYYQHYGDLAYLESPAYDLSANGGNVSVSVDLYGQPIDELDECTAVIRLLQYVSDDETKVLSSKTTAELPAEWTNVKVDLTKGTKNTAVEICSKAGYLYINNILITQDLKAGEKISVPYISCKTENNEIEIPVYNYLCGGNITVKLRAVKELWDAEHFSVDEYVRSAYSQDYTHTVSETAGIDNTPIAAAQPKAFVRNGDLIIVNPDADNIEVFDSLGHLIASDNSHNNLVIIPLDSKGVLIVRVGATTIKAIN